MTFTFQSLQINLFNEKYRVNIPDIILNLIVQNLIY